MIPKLIHYCWIGNKPLPKLAKKCIASWGKIMPDYEIKLWNEKNYDFAKNEFMKNAYIQKKWGFVPDYARLDIIYNYGGIYLDTDVEVLKPFDNLLKYHAFCGFESQNFVAFGLGFGAEKKNKIIKRMLEQYEKMSFNIDDETMSYFSSVDKKNITKWQNNNTIPSPILQTQILRNNYGLKQNNTRQTLEFMEVFPTSYFCPRNSANMPVKTNTAYSVHWYMASWQPFYRRFYSSVKKFLLFILRNKIVYLYKLKNKINGIKE